MKSTVSSINHLGESVCLWTIATLTSSVFNGVFKWFNEWVFADWVSLNWFFVLLFVDTAAGVGMHIKNKTFSAKELLFTTLINKVFVSCVWFILVHVVTKFTSTSNDEDAHVVVDFFKNGVLFIYFLQSIIDNVFTITDGKFPPLYGSLIDLVSKNKKK